MWVPRQDHSNVNKDAVTMAVGVLGGLAIGMLLSRRVGAGRLGDIGSELRDRASSVARRLRPARMQRLSGEQQLLTRLEDTVLDAFLGDSLLSGRGVDIGAISMGIIELSGEVYTEDEADRAVRLANSIPGVRSVVNRLDVSNEGRYRPRSRDDDQALEHEVSRVGGMGPRRQGRQTDPDRPDDSLDQERTSLRRADQEQWMDEGYAHKSPRMSAAEEVQDRWRTRYDEDELDNQDPHGRHASRTLDDQPRDYNTSARVGEGVEPGAEMSLEGDDLSMKPHQKGRDGEGD